MVAEGCGSEEGTMSQRAETAAIVGEADSVMAALDHGEDWALDVEALARLVQRLAAVVDRQAQEIADLRRSVYAAGNTASCLANGTRPD